MASPAQKLIPVIMIEGIIITGLVISFVMQWISLPILIAGVVVASSFVAFFVVSISKQVRLGDGTPVDLDRSNEAEGR